MRVEIRRDLEAISDTWRSARVCVLRLIQYEIERDPTVKIAISNWSPRFLKVVQFALITNDYKRLQYDGERKTADQNSVIEELYDQTK